jgi:hypothetical protein
VSNETGVLRVVKSANACQKAHGRGKHRTPGESAVSWNQQGQPGVQGVQGVQGGSGVQGQKGDTGSTGPSDIYAVGPDNGVSLSTSGQTEVASLTVPAGSYLIGASLWGIKSASGSTDLHCSLTDGGSVFWGDATTGLTDGAPRGSISLVGADTFSAPETIEVVCNQVAVAVFAMNPRLWAIKTSSLHATLSLGFN